MKSQLLKIGIFTGGVFAFTLLIQIIISLLSLLIGENSFLNKHISLALGLAYLLFVVYYAILVPKIYDVLVVVDYRALLKDIREYFNQHLFVKASLIIVVNAILVVFLLFGVDSIDGLVETINDKDFLNFYEIVLLVIFFSFNLLAIFMNVLKQFAKGEFQLDNMKMNMSIENITVIGIVLILVYYLRWLIVPVFGLLLLVVSILSLIVKRIYH